MTLLRIQDERRVAYRALSLGALLVRGELELTLQNLDEWLFFDEARDRAQEDYESRSRRLDQWLKDEKIAPHLSQTERHLLQIPLGNWSERTLTTVGWRVEALGAMLWALNRLDEIPDYDQQYEPEDVLTPLDVYHPTIDFVWLASLRSDEELSAARDQAELWNWRSRATELERLGIRPREGVSFKEIIRVTAERAYLAGHIPPPIDGDFPAFGKSYSYLDPDEYALMSAIACERYVALSWVCELSSEWDSMPIDR